MLHIILSFALISPVQDAKDQVAFIVKQLPLWEADSLAQFEQPELLKVEADLKVVELDEDEDDFLRDVATLRADWRKLAAVDKLLHVTDVI